MDKVFKALADPGRRALLDQLFSRNGQTLSELCHHLAMTRQGVSKHLRLLHGANLVVHIWRGREKLHFLNPVPLKEISESWIDKYPGRIPIALRELEQGLAPLEIIGSSKS
jgi:DNA-binding transcriptional ArsR family regulator